MCLFCNVILRPSCKLNVECVCAWMEKMAAVITSLPHQCFSLVNCFFLKMNALWITYWCSCHQTCVGWCCPKSEVLKARMASRADKCGSGGRSETSTIKNVTRCVQISDLTRHCRHVLFIFASRRHRKGISLVNNILCRRRLEIF